MQVAPGAVYEAAVDWGVTGLAASLGMRVIDNEGGTTVARVTGFTEYPAGSGVYARGGNVAPTVGGQYTLVYDDGSTTPGHIATDDLLVTYSSGSGALPTGRDLCTLERVKSYVPAYRPNAATDAKLAELITSESDLIELETGREIIGYGDQPASRSFAFSLDDVNAGSIDVGDLASAGDTDITVELLAADETVLSTVARSKYRAVYGTRRQPRSPWEPITALEFPMPLGAPSLQVGQSILVTGNWGFPQIPTFIAEACAKRVILRYVTEVASSGDAFSEAAAELNLAGLFASARDAVDRIGRPAVA